MILIIALILFFSNAALAMETDQFTTPPTPLYDLGPRLDEKVKQTIADIIKKKNTKIIRYEKRIAKTKRDSTRRHNQKKIDKLLDPDSLAKDIYKALGDGLPQCKLEKWIKKQKAPRIPHAPKTPVIFKHPLEKSVIGVPITKLLIVTTGLAPTINIHSHYIGNDKLGHLFQQGHEYYKWYRQREGKGDTHQQCIDYAVKKGVAQEKGIYGTFMSGIYSNADLASDYAGLVFYLNLTRQINIDRTTLQPILIINNNHWQFNPLARTQLVKPFISDHFSEALNPNLYTKSLRKTVRKAVKKRAQTIIAFYKTDKQIETKRLASLSTWYGQNYGHSGPNNLITIPNTCFTDQPQTQN